MDVASNADWECGSGRYEANAFGADTAAEDWLISPPLDLDATSNEYLEFVSEKDFDDVGDDKLELLASTDYNGGGTSSDVATATWNSVVGSFPTGDDPTSSGLIDISGLSGSSVYFAFKYTSTGTGGGTSERWRIHSVTVTANNDPAPTVTSTTPTDSATDVAASTNIAVTFSEAVDVSGNWLEVDCNSSGTRSVGNGDFNVTGGPTTYTLDPTSDFTAGETCNATVFASQVSDQDTDDPLDNLLQDETFSFTIAGAFACIPTHTIQQVQGPAGSTAISPLFDETVTVQGIVTAVFDDEVFVQQGTGARSGVRVFKESATTVNVGDDVCVTGPVTERFSMTQIGGGSDGDFNANPRATVTVLSTGNALPAAEVVPASDLATGAFNPTTGASVAEDWEAVLVTVEDVIVTNANLGFGEVEISDLTDFLRVDDKSNWDSSDAVELGEQVDSLTGVLDFTFDDFKLQPRSVADFDGANAPIVANCPGIKVTQGNATQVTIEATDADNTMAGVVLSNPPTGISRSTPTGAGTSTISADVNVADTVPAGLYNVLATFTNADGQIAVCSVSIAVEPGGNTCAAPANTLQSIANIQGSLNYSPLEGDDVTVRGVVTGDYQTGTDNLGGFFIQEPADGDSDTSDGIFVFHTSTVVDEGDVVQVSGTVAEADDSAERENSTVIDSVTAVEVCGPSAPTINPTTVTLPVPAGTSLEPYEGMLIEFDQQLTVTQNFFQGRYGQVVLSANGRMFNPTNGNGLGDTPDLNFRRSFVLDNGATDDNGEQPNPMPYIIRQGTNPDDYTLRAGDTTNNVVGLLEEGQLGSGDNGYRLHPQGGPESVTFTRVNARTTAPDDVGGEITVASFNVLNYFTTLQQDNGSARGADDAEEFIRQHRKIVNAIVAMDADVIGLIEIENIDPTAAVNFLLEGGTVDSTPLNGLNDVLGAGTYAEVDSSCVPTFGSGGDAIKVTILYKPAVVTPSSTAAICDNDPVNDRPTVAQTFSVVGVDGSEFTLLNNHFKSKGSITGGSGSINEAQQDGRGNNNYLRRLQSEQLMNFINTNIDSGDFSTNILVMGDLNSYGAEEPIIDLEVGTGLTGTSLTTGGLINLVARDIAAAERYSYIFSPGQSGYLDHALASNALADRIVGTTVWLVNADEPAGIDYNTDFRTTGGGTGEDLYSEVSFRSSDHDPVMVGINFSNTPPVISESDPQSLTVDFETSDSLTLNATDGDGDTLTWSISTAASNGTASVSGTPTGNSQTVTYTPDAGFSGSDSFVVQVSDGNGGTDTIRVNVTVNDEDPTSSGPTEIHLPFIAR